MSKKNGKKYYGVRVGRKIGVFDNWPECKKQTDGFSNAAYKGFFSEQEAWNFVNGKKNTVSEGRTVSKAETEKTSKTGKDTAVRSKTVTKTTNKYLEKNTAELCLDLVQKVNDSKFSVKNEIEKIIKSKDHYDPQIESIKLNIFNHFDGILDEIKKLIKILKKV